MTKKPKRSEVIECIATNGLSRPISEACGISRQAVAQWQEVPWNRVLEVERITGIPRHKIRSDIYPAKKKRRART